MRWAPPRGCITGHPPSLSPKRTRWRLSPFRGPSQWMVARAALQGKRLNRATTFLGPSMVISTLGEVPEASPSQWSNTYPSAGKALRVTTVPARYVPPDGETLPPPVGRETLSTKCASGATVWIGVGEGNPGRDGDTGVGVDIGAGTGPGVGMGAVPDGTAGVGGSGTTNVGGSGISCIAFSKIGFPGTGQSLDTGVGSVPASVPSCFAIW